MAVVKSWRTRDARWLVDRVIDEPGIRYRIWYEGTRVGELPDDPGALCAWLAARHVDVAELALPADEDPLCEQPLRMAVVASRCQSWRALPSTVSRRAPTPDLVELTAPTHDVTDTSTHARRQMRAHPVSSEVLLSIAPPLIVAH
ncbi:MAG TPA: hypothetical protein VGR06_17315 [Actinophytocola sp.]|uniref:hypothetical protein n=1 Tax=Actinophytocola sp. TaxID=1872138 RepID=UPI002DFA5057|nr:hypothetical protein [Actinophytocola sp.]